MKKKSQDDMGTFRARVAAMSGHREDNAIGETPHPSGNPFTITRAIAVTTARFPAQILIKESGMGNHNHIKKTNKTRAFSYTIKKHET